MAEVHTKRNLKARHLEMIAIGGTIGTGLFVGSGVALNSAGPAGTLAAYSITGVFVYFIVCSLGEMAALLPVSGSFNEYASRFVDPSLGFTMGWNYWFSWAITLPIEMAAASLVMQFWFPNVPPFVWSTIVLAVATILNIFSVKAFGEAEFWFSLVKVVAVIIFIIFGLVVALKDGVYFTNWNIPQAPFVGGVAGTFSAFMTAFFSYGGTEIVGIAAGEAANPTVTIPRAIKNTFYRILIFYMGAIFVIGLLVPFNAPGLADSASRTSPFTLALQAAKVAGTYQLTKVLLISLMLLLLSR